MINIAVGRVVLERDRQASCVTSDKLHDFSEPHFHGYKLEDDVCLEFCYEDEDISITQTHDCCTVDI